MKDKPFIIGLPTVKAIFPTSPIADLVSVEPMTQRSPGDKTTLEYRTTNNIPWLCAMNAIQKRTPHFTSPYRMWEITVAEYATMTDVREDIITILDGIPGAQLYLYDDIQFLSGTAGVIVRANGRAIASHAWLRS